MPEPTGHTSGEFSVSHDQLPTVDPEPIEASEDPTDTGDHWDADEDEDEQPAYQWNNESFYDEDDLLEAISDHLHDMLTAHGIQLASYDGSQFRLNINVSLGRRVR